MHERTTSTTNRARGTATPPDPDPEVTDGGATVPHAERIMVRGLASGIIAGTLHLPSRGEPRAALVIHPATAVPERIYLKFAGFLTTRGFAVVTYDYRGTGASGDPRSNRHLRMRDWMDEDVPAVAAWAHRRFPDLPHVAIGHSIGGHAMALGNGTEGLAGFLAIASHAGVTRSIPDTTERIKVATVLRVLGPTTARTLGYVPGRRLGLGEDMPGAAMLEWSRWSRMPGYFFDDPSMDAADRAASVSTEVLSLGFTDAPWATRAQIDAIYGRMASAHVERRTVSPAEAGVERIGQLGFFRSEVRATLWAEAAEWLEGRAASARDDSVPAREEVSAKGTDR